MSTPVAVKWYHKFCLRLKALAYRLFLPAHNRTVIGSCKRCGQCCRELILILDKQPVRDEKLLRKKSNWTNFYRYLEVVGHTEDGRLKLTCRLLDKDNNCTINSYKPSYCQSFPSPELYKWDHSSPADCGLQIVPRIPFKDFLDGYR